MGSARGERETAGYEPLELSGWAHLGRALAHEEDQATFDLAKMFGEMAMVPPVYLRILVYLVIYDSGSDPE